MRDSVSLFNCYLNSKLCQRARATVEPCYVLVERTQIGHVRKLNVEHAAVIPQRQLD